jgi:hypothetical protein
MRDEMEVTSGKSADELLGKSEGQISNSSLCQLLIWRLF